MLLPYHEQLDTVHLQRLFDNMSECYKLFWFQAIVEQVHAGKTLLSYDELINSMIADAWYLLPTIANVLPSNTMLNISGGVKIAVALIALLMSMNAAKHPAKRYRKDEMPNEPAE